MTVPALTLLLALGGCLGSRPKSSVPTGPGETGTPAPSETCNGEDDDGDGEVDEGAADLDADGVADCLDDTCELADIDTAWEAPDSACGTVGAPSVAPWAIEPFWSMSSELGCANPRVGDLDTDGVAEVVCVDSADGTLQVIRGDDGTLVWRDRLLDRRSGLVLADVDGEPGPEILGFDPAGAVVASRSDGTLVWRGDTPNPITVRDVDGDGTPELLTRRGVVSGLDGSLRTTIEPEREPERDWEAEIAVGDFDQDGQVKLASGRETWEADGTPFGPPPDSWHGTITPLLVQADSDPAAEIVWFGSADFVVVDDTGTALWTTTSDDEITYALPCAGDIDADGETELVAAGVGATLAFDLDGTALWSAASVDETGSYVACTVFDFDGDGAGEVVLGDQGSMYVLDGRTGDVRYEDDSRWSNTFGDAPLVVDLDGDGSVEILLGNPLGAGYDGYPLRAWRNQDRDWPRGTSIWPTSNWSGTGVLEDGSVERAPDEPWLTRGVWRGQPEWPALGADLVAVVDGSCASACEAPGRVRLRVYLANLGPSESRPGTPLAVYGASEGTELLLEVFTTDTWLAPGERSEAFEIEAEVGEVAGGLRVVAGDDGTGSLAASDCAPENNVTDWWLEGCD